MQLTFLGSGSAFCAGSSNYQSNLVLSSPSGKCLLIDCGSDIRFSLAASGMRNSDITDIYISHLHSDHVGGMEYMGFSSRFGPQPHRPNLYLSETLVDDLWQHSLSGGMRTIEEEEKTNLSSFFVPNIITQGGGFEWEGIDFELVPTRHVEGPHGTMFSYGLFFSIAGQAVFFTADTKFAPKALKKFMQKADVIFHDCETTRNHTGVHAHYEDLVTLPSKIREKMWLYHYDDGELPDPVTDSFRGFVRRGQSFDF